MTPERWQKVSEVFAAALERPAPHRAAYLQSVCGSDCTLREEVESLLEYDADRPGFLVVSASATRAAGALAETDEAGLRLGPYVLVRRVASGGMGAVWLAHRVDEQFQGFAAVKLIKRGMDTDDILRRFRQERQLLANLRHPNICRLLDGGAAPDGRPYLIMEYVDGLPIDEYCDRNRLSVHQRLRLFCRVCAVVQSAHQNLVIHRDLKPGNILVTPSGEPVLLDFGIAKVLGPGGVTDVSEQTTPDRRMLTPQYASPEQIRGEPITTASDVYSLGVILYELLTGHGPYVSERGTRGELEREVLERDPERPSTIVLRDAPERARVRTCAGGEPPKTGDAPRSSEELAGLRSTDPIRLRRTLSGDLDTIVLKALRKETARRYTSVEQLSEDIRRYLDGAVVTARPDTFRYRATKFVRRNRMPVALAVVFVAILTGLSATMTVQSFRLRDERNRARTAERLAGETERFLREMLRSIEPSVAKGRDTQLLREMLDAASLRVWSEFEEQPLLAARLHLLVGDLYHKLGWTQEANPHLREGLALRRKWCAGTIEEAHAMGALARNLSRTAKLDEAEQLVRASLDICRKLYGDADHPDMSRATSNLANIRARRGHLDESEKLYEQSLAMQQRLRGRAGRQDPEAEAALASVWNDLGSIRMSRGDHVGAKAFFLSALEHWRIAGERTREWYGICLTNLAICFKVARDFDAAEAAAWESLAILREFTGGTGRFWTRNVLGTIYLERGNYAAAEEIYSAAYEERKASGMPPDAMLAALGHNVGALLLGRGDAAGAEPHLSESHRLLKELIGDQEQDVSVTARTLALALLELRRFEEAEALLLKALSIDAGLVSFSDPVHPGNTFAALATFYSQAYGATQTARALYEQSLCYFRSAANGPYPDMASPLSGLAELLLAEGDTAGAAALVNESYALLCAMLEPDHPDWCPTLHALGALRMQEGRYADAEDCLREGRRICELRLLPQHSWRIRTLERLAQLHTLDSREELAEDCRREIDALRASATERSVTWSRAALAEH